MRAQTSIHSYVSLDETLALIDGTERNFEQSFDVISNEDIPEELTTKSTSFIDADAQSLDHERSNNGESRESELENDIETSTDTLKSYCILQ